MPDSGQATRSRVNPLGIYEDAMRPLREQLAALEEAQRQAEGEIKAEVDGLTSAQRLEAIKAIIPDAELREEGAQWRLVLPRLRMARDLPAQWRHWGVGATADAAIDNAWFYLTSPDAPHGTPPKVTRAQNMVIVPLGAPQNQSALGWPTRGGFECWVRWNGFMWAPYCVQSCDARKWEPEC